MVITTGGGLLIIMVGIIIIIITTRINLVGITGDGVPLTKGMVFTDTIIMDMVIIIGAPITLTSRITGDITSLLPAPMPQIML